MTIRKSFTLASVLAMLGASASAILINPGDPLINPGDTAIDPTGIVLTLQPFATSGTGAIDPFLRVQGTGNATTETGFNTSATPPPLDAKAGPFTRDLLLSSLQIVQFNPDGPIPLGSYYQFSLDINEVQSLPDNQITLTMFDLYTGTVANRTNLTGALLQVSLANDYQIVTINGGSGAGDVQIYVPVSYFAVTSGPFLTLNTTFTGSDSGFEEFSAVQGPNRAVPDGGTAVALLGMALVGIEGLRRKLGSAIG